MLGSVSGVCVSDVQAETPSCADMKGLQMATQHQSARHVTAHNTILLWLGGLLVLVGTCVFVVYYELRADGGTVIESESANNSIAKVQLPESSAEIVRAHTAAIADAASKETHKRPVQ